MEAFYQYNVGLMVYRHPWPVLFEERVHRVKASMRAHVLQLKYIENIQTLPNPINRVYKPNRKKISSTNMNLNLQTLNDGHTNESTSEVIEN